MMNTSSAENNIRFDDIIAIDDMINFTNVLVEVEDAVISNIRTLEQKLVNDPNGEVENDRLNSAYQKRLQRLKTK
jgi:hypothetical protein